MEAVGAVPESGDDARFAVLETANLSVLRESAAAIAAMQVLELKALAATGWLAIERARASRVDGEVALKSVAAEYAAGRMSDRSAKARIDEAMRLVDLWPNAVDAWGDGRISRQHVRTIDDAGSVLTATSVDPVDRERFEGLMIERATETTPGRLRLIAVRAANRLVTGPLTARHRAARDERRVRVHDGEDGMATVVALLPAVLAHGIHERLVTGARAKSLDDPRTMPQHMADEFAELLLTGTGGAGALEGVRATVSVVIPATTLLSDSDVELDGATGTLLGTATLVDLDTVRELAVDAATWERLFTHPVTGAPIATDTYTPTRSQRRLLRYRDRTCRFPGCSAGSSRSDLDHTVDWQHGGETALANLGYLCRRHHILKHASAWAVRQLASGVFEWTSPAGKVYVDEPEPVGPRFRTVEPPGSHGDIWATGPPGMQGSANTSVDPPPF